MRADEDGMPMNNAMAWRFDDWAREDISRQEGTYRLYEELAVGTTCAVHLGVLEGASGFRRPVAIKRLLRKLVGHRGLSEELRHEAYLASQVRHPNTIPVIDLVCERGEVYVVMEYVLGETLVDTFKEGERAPVDVAVAIMAGVLRGLHAAHIAKSVGGESLGIVHRDVSPRKILVGVDGVSRIIDFGGATSALNLGPARGTIEKVRYAAPEQLTKESVDSRADIYAAGVVLWELLTGERLFAHGGPQEALTARANLNLVPASRFNSQVPAAIDAALARALQWSPEDRYQTAEELANDLEAAVQPSGPARIGWYVERAAASAIESRRSLLDAMEADPPAASGARAIRLPKKPMTQRPKPPPEPARQAERIYPRAALAVVLGALGVVLVAALAMALARRHRPNAVSLVTPLPRLEANLASATPSVADPSLGPASVLAADVPQTSVGKPAPPALANAGAHAQSKESASNRARCAQPFFYDRSGIKRLKRSCF
jgi:eukaryotic-like serine/threonine-protein kinase